MRAFLVLRCFTLEEPDLCASEIAQKSELHKSTVHRLLQTLCAERVLERNSATGRYSIGPALYMMGSLYLQTTNVLKAGASVARAVNELCGEAVSIGLLDHGHVTLVLREETTYGFKWSRHVGSIIPAYASAMGKALLSELADAEIDRLFPEERLLPVTSKTLPSRESLKRNLAECRRTGVAIDSEGGVLGIVSLGALIRDATGEAIAGMSLAGPIFNMSVDRLPELSQLLRHATGLLSYLLGYNCERQSMHDVDALKDWWQTSHTSFTGIGDR